MQDMDMDTDTDTDTEVTQIEEIDRFVANSST